MFFVLFQLKLSVIKCVRSKINIMDKIKNHHSTSFFVDQLLNISLPLDEKLNKNDLTVHLPINQNSTSLTDSLSLISNCMTYDRQRLNQLNGKKFV